MSRTLEILRRAAAPLLAALLVALGVVTQAPADVSNAQPVAVSDGQTHYLPWDAAEFKAVLEGMYGAASPGNIDSPIRLITSMVSAVDGNEVVIDHWEDGYDADPFGAPGATSVTLNLDEGETHVLDNWVPTGSPATIDYDGGDRVVSSGALVVTAGGWPTGATTLHAGAAVVRDTNAFGYEFVAPVGEDVTYGGTGEGLLATQWEYVGLVVVAAEDATTVTLDDGSTVSLDAGETHLVNGGVNIGDTVTADRPVSVFLATGDNGAQWEGRLFDLVPTEQWADEYLTPVSSGSGTSLRTRVFLYNPGATAITVGYTQSGGGTGTISVPAGGHANHIVPQDQGVRYSSPGNPFYALHSITTPESGSGNDQSRSYNWGFSLVPTTGLTPMVVLGYAPGSDGNTEVDSPVWVAPTAATTLYIDLDADPTTGPNTDPNGNKYNFSCAAGALQPRLIKDYGGTSCFANSAFESSKGTGDGDMTGARIYTVDGTDIAAAWGQVPGLNAVAPAIDMGTTVLPFPTLDMVKDAEIVGDDGDGLAEPGDTIRYTITITNRGLQPVDDLLLTDDIPEHTTYVEDSTTTNGSPYPDAATGTPFGFDEGGALLPPAIGVGETRTVSFDVVVDDPLAPGVTEIENNVFLDSDYGDYTDVKITPVADPGSVGDRVWDDQDGDGVQDVGEPGLVGVTVVLRNDAGDEVATTTTGANGVYLFDGIYPGDYTVEVDPGSLPAGRTPTADPDGVGSPHSAAFSLAAGQDRTDVDFGYAEAAITIEKTVAAGLPTSCPGTELVEQESGEPVTYCFVVTNSGEVTLTDVEVTDADLGLATGDLDLVSGNPASLAPGATVTFRATVSVSSDLVNTATATGHVGSGGPTVEDSDTAEVDLVGPGIQIEKTVYRGHTDGAGCPGADLETVRNGDAVTYCFEVTNTGESPLSAVVVTDVDLGIEGDDLVIAGLARGESQMLWWEATASGDLVNTASVVGTSPAGVQPSDEDTAEVDEISPAIEVRKTVYRGDTDGAGCPGAVEETFALAGDTVTWCFEVVNTGDVDLADVTLDDPALLADETDMTVLSGSLASLPAGGTVALYLEGPASTDLANTVTASGTPPVGPDVTDDDTAAIDVIAPVVSLEKTVYAGHDGGAGCDTAGESVTGEAGDEVTWCFAVTNAADEGALSDITVADPDLGIDETDLTVVGPGDLADLVEGETVVLFYEGAIDGSLVNTATATGRPPLGPDVSDEDDASVTEVVPGVSIEKTVYEGHDGGASCEGGELVAGEDGQEVTWCFVVTNTGETALNAVTITDPDLGLTLPVPDLAVGQGAVVHHDGMITADVVNTASVSAESPNGSIVEGDDTAEVNLLAPAVTVDKGVYAGHTGGAGCAAAGDHLTARAGDAVTWCFTVTNSGDTRLDVVLEDLDLGVTSGPTGGMTVVTGSLDDMAPGDVAVLRVDDTVDGDLDNTVEATGTTPRGVDVTDRDTASVDEIRPAISVVKSVYGRHDDGAGCARADDVHAGEAGSAVTWCFTVTNTGDSDLSDLRVVDADLGIALGDLTPVGPVPSPLGPGDVVTFFFEGTLNGDLTNTVSVSATPPLGPDVADEDTASVTELVPGVRVEKSVVMGHDGPGSCPGGERVVARAAAPVTWCFVVTNTGEVPLDVTVEDPDLGFSETVADLTPGNSVTLTHEGTVSGDLVNVATVTGETPDGDEVTDDDDAEVDEVDPSIRVDKTVYAGHDDGGDCAGAESVEAERGAPVTWCFLITNTGDATLTDLTLDDAVLGVDEGDAVIRGAGSWASLAAGDSMMVYVEGTVPGDVVNTVTVTGQAPDDSAPSDTDTASVRTISPQIGVAKRVIAAPTGNGDGSYDLTYRIRVTNAGETPLTAVQVVDDLTETFVGVESFRVLRVVSDELSVNRGYNGKPSGSTALLNGGDRLGVGERGDIEITVRVVPGNGRGPFRNTAVAFGTSPRGEDVQDLSDSGSNADPTDPNPGEPGDTGGTDDPVPVQFPPVDLTVTKTVASVQGDPTAPRVVWELVVTNNGPGDDPGPITLVDTLDRALRFVAASGDGWSCTAAGQTVTCVHDAPLAAGAPAEPVLISTVLRAPAGTTVPNTAEVSSTLDESDLDNNADTASVSSDDLGTGSTPTGTLPRTGATIGGLVLVALALLLGGRTLRRRAAMMGG